MYTAKLKQSRKKENIKRIHLNNEVGNKELISETNKITNIFTHKDSLQQKEGIETTVGMIDIVQKHNTMDIYNKLETLDDVENFERKKFPMLDTHLNYQSTRDVKQRYIQIYKTSSIVSQEATQNLIQQIGEIRERRGYEFQNAGGLT